MGRILCFACMLLFIGCKSDKKQEQEDRKYTTPSSQTKSPQTPETEESIARGAKIYNNFCATCHLASGEGIANAFPPLNNSDWLTEKRTESIQAVKFGLRGPIKVNGESYNSLMADLGLEDQEVVDVMNYILTAWDNNITPPVTLEEVAELRE